MLYAVTIFSAGGIGHPPSGIMSVGESVLGVCGAGGVGGVLAAAVGVVVAGAHEAPGATPTGQGAITTVTGACGDAQAAGVDAGAVVGVDGGAGGGVGAGVGGVVGAPTGVGAVPVVDGDVVGAGFGVDARGMNGTGYARSFGANIRLSSPSEAGA